MGWDLEKQHSVHVPGVQIEHGIFDFTNGSRTLDVPTRLTKKFGGFAMVDATSQDVTQFTLFGTAIGDPSNGAVTFQRHGGMDAEDARMAYMLFGF